VEDKKEIALKELDRTPPTGYIIGLTRKDK
jgi:hypothetical protein